MSLGKCWLVFVLAAHLFNKGSQTDHSGIQVRTGRELLVVNGQNESACAALLLCKLGQITVTGYAQHFKAFAFNGLSQRTNAQTGGVLRAVVFVNDDNGETKFHGQQGLCAQN
jgi:hypothetical protein